MITTIISNNCMGGVIYFRHNMEIKSPTIKLQIMPEEYAKFCANIHHYMETDVKEYKPEDMSEEHKTSLIRMYDKIPDSPYGLLDDIVIAFSHYDTFEYAQRIWYRRRERIEWDHIAYIMHIHYRDRGYEKEVKEFLSLNLPHSAAFTNGFRAGGSYKFTIPEEYNIDDFGWYGGKYAIEMGSGFNELKFLNGEL